MRRTSIVLTLLVALGGTIRTSVADEPARLRITDGEFAAGSVSISDVRPGESPSISYDTTTADAIFDAPDFCWYSQVQAVMLRRTPIKSQTLVVEDPSAGTNPFAASIPRVNANELSFNNNAQLGLGLTLGRQIDAISTFELHYWGLMHWTSGSVTYGANSLSIPGTLAITTQDFFLADEAALAYESNLNNVELNYQQTLNGMSLLAGFRYINIYENLDMRFHDIDSGTSNYNVHTVNHLIGGQIGLGWHLEASDRLTADFFSKIGVFGNAQRMSQWMADFNNTLPRRDTKDFSSHTSFVAEVGVNVRYRLSEFVAIFGGYRFMWLTGLALAPSQVDFNDAPGAGATFSAQNDNFKLYGPHAGIEIRW